MKQPIKHFFEYISLRQYRFEIIKSYLVVSLLLFVSVKGVAQEAQARMSLNLQNATVEQIINKIEEITPLRFVYSEQSVNIKRRVTVQVQNERVDKILSIIFNGTNTQFVIEGKRIVLSLKPVKEDRKVMMMNVSGVVSDSKGEEIIGANIIIKGSKRGTITDNNGKFTLEVPVNAQLLVSYIGFQQQVVEINGQSNLKIQLKEQNEFLDEVVVTALGIRREKKALGYSVQEIKSEQLNTTGDASAMNALQGKVAGLQISTASTGLSGSAKVTIRGNTSLTDNNQPLWIVDGVPFSERSTSDASMYGGIDRGSTAVDINPEDIETISVLKGPNAAALYGSRANNGVILVTTKKGIKKEGFGVTYNANITWTEVIETLHQQTRYGQGKDGIYNSGTKGSWGGLLDGSAVSAWNGETLPYSVYGNKLKDFFNTGFSQNQTISMGNVKEDSHFRSSFGLTDNKGLIPGESLRKYNIDVNSGMKMNKYLSIDAKVTLSNTRAENRPIYGTYSQVNQLLVIPNNVRLQDLRQYSSKDKMHINWYGPDIDTYNPYFLNHAKKNSDERWRAFGYTGIKLELTNWLRLSSKYAFDYYQTRLQSTDLGGGFKEMNISKVTEDQMYRGNETFFEHNFETMLSGNNSITDLWGVSYMIGGNYMFNQQETLGTSVRNMVYKDKWYFNAANVLNSASNQIYRRGVNSVYGSVQLAWNNSIYLDLTARNDWSSTLPKENNSYFYPSASLSFIATDFIKNTGGGLPAWLNYAKARLSAAQVGKDTEPYSTYNRLRYYFDNGLLIVEKSNILMNSKLKPEISTSYEGGLEMKFLNNRLGFDFTYYFSQTRNQIMKIPHIAPWDGGQMVNAGLVTNRGIELMVYATPIKTRDFQFDLDLNLSHNNSIVNKLADELPTKYMFFNGDDMFPINVGVKEGGRLGEIYAKTLYKRNEKGELIIGTNGLPIRLSGDNVLRDRLDNPIGNIQPDLLMSLTPRFTYKGISLAVMFDAKIGGDIVSVTEAVATQYGMSKRTLNRGFDKGGKIIVPGVREDGTPNNMSVDASYYYGLIGGINGVAEEFVYNASFIKLKEVSLGYSLPKEFLKKTPLNTMKVSFVARNLIYLLNYMPGTSPEGGFNTSMFSQAIDFSAVPYSRTMGFSLIVGF